MTARAASAVLVALPFAGCQATGVNPPAPTSADSPTPPASSAGAIRFESRSVTRFVRPRHVQCLKSPRLPLSATSCWDAGSGIGTGPIPVRRSSRSPSAWPVLRSPSVIFESTISIAESPTQGGDSFAASPRVVPGLRAAGFDLLSLANNHVGDYGGPRFTPDLVSLLQLHDRRCRSGTESGPGPQAGDCVCSEKNQGAGSRREFLGHAGTPWHVCQCGSRTAGVRCQEAVRCRWRSPGHCAGCAWRGGQRVRNRRHAADTLIVCERRERSN
jgi:hypothetical protein